MITSFGEDRNCHLMRLWYFSYSVNSFFKRACAAIQFFVGRLLPYSCTTCQFANSECFGEMRRLAWAFAGRLWYLSTITHELAQMVYCLFSYLSRCHRHVVFCCVSFFFFFFFSLFFFFHVALLELVIHFIIWNQRVVWKTKSLFYIASTEHWHYKTLKSTLLEREEFLSLT